jgi:hypothetical protein
MAELDLESFVEMDEKPGIDQEWRGIQNLGWR